MIVAITSHHVKGHTPEGLAHRFVAKIEPRDREEQLRVGVCPTLPEIKMVHRAKRLNMVFTRLPAGGDVAIEAPGHKVRPTVLLQQPARRYLNARRLCHERIGVFDTSVTFAGSQLFVFADAVEFKQPMFESRRCIELATTHLIGLGIPGDDRLCARAAR